MKKIQILIIVLVLILTLGCATFAVLYFSTDIFKSEQEMFYKYAKQINLKEFIDLEGYSNYSKRLENEAHASEGRFDFKVAGDLSVSESIKYNGYIDTANKTANYDISINKDDETLLAMNYLKKQDLHGVLFKDVVNQYLIIENNNLKEFAYKLGVQDTSGIPDKIELPETSGMNFEELNSILDKYLNIAIETIPEDNYSKIEKTQISVGDKKVEVDGYQVKLKLKDVQTILTKLLEQAKDDEQVFNLIKNDEMETFEDYQYAIEEALSSLSGEISKEENVDFATISIYKNGKNTVKLSINITQEEYNSTEISIEKTDKGLRLRSLNTQINYAGTQDQKSIVITKTANSEEQETIQCIISEISDGEETPVTNANLTRNGALTSNNVEFDLKITSNITLTGLANLSVSIESQNAVNFQGKPLEGDFVQGNHLVINGLTAEQLNNLVTNLGALLGEKLKDEMFVLSIVGMNESLFESAEQATQNTQDALEIEESVSQIEQENTVSNQFSPEDVRVNVDRNYIFN